MPRALEFTQEVADIICERIADGQSLRSICTDEEMPSTSTVCKWLGRLPDFAEQYARAREAQADTLFDEILTIADDGSNDTYLDDEGNQRTEQDVIARSRLRVDARKWMAGKLRPKKYGEKLDIDATATVGVTDPLMALLTTIATSGKRLGNDGNDQS